MQKQINLKWWQLALLTLAVSFLGRLSSAPKDNNRREMYEKELDQAPWAPPGWLFAPAWTLNNFILLLGLQRILQQKDLPVRKKLLVMHAFIWVIFFSFGFVYGNRKSPVLAAVWTVCDTLLAGASLLISYRHDKKIALSFLPLFLWTLYASTVAGYQALANPDPELETPQPLS